MAETALEGTVKRAVKKYLDELGPLVYHVKQTSDQPSGTPDILLCCNGRFIAFELKRPGEEPTKLQARRMEEIRAAGGEAYVIHSAEEAEMALRGVKR